MKQILIVTLFSVAVVPSGYGQIDHPKIEFEAASIRVNPARTGFRFGSDTSGNGGPGSNNPGMYRCSNCTLAALLSRAFELRNYQLPARASLAENTFEVMARIPDGASQEDFQAMLQNFLRDRFKLAFHFTEKNLKGYHLVVARGGLKLKESQQDSPMPSASESSSHSASQSSSHTHNGLVNFGGSASFRGDHQSTADLARMLADELGVPVDDQTGLQGQYDIALTWSGNASSHAGNHAEGGWSGAGGHGDHGLPAGSPGAASRDMSGPTLFEAVQSQLGLRLVQSDQTMVRILVIDHIDPVPTAN